MGLGTFLGFTPDAWGQQEPSRDEVSASAPVRATDKEESNNPFRGSSLHFEQSMNTQAAHVELDPQQSYVPLYEIWFSFRPRYYFDEHWSLRGRFDYTKELTNNQPTTYYREDVFGDIWTDLVYSTDLDALWRGTKASLGARVLLPTSKVSEANGTYFTLGGTANARHRFQIHGPDATVLNEFDLSLNVTYLHPFTTATTPTDYGNFAYARQDVDEFSFTSDQIQGQTLVNHTLWGIINTELRITPKLSVSASGVVINQWHYQPSNSSVRTVTGMVTPSNANPQVTSDPQFTQFIWLIGSVDYILLDGELDVSLGYYNLANAIAPDGNRRGLWGPDNIWQSPDARVFLDLTANLDVLYNDASHHRYSTAQAGEAARLRHVADLSR